MCGHTLQWTGHLHRLRYVPCAHAAEYHTQALNTGNKGSLPMAPTLPATANVVAECSSRQTDTDQKCDQGRTQWPKDAAMTTSCYNRRFAARAPESEGRVDVPRPLPGLLSTKLYCLHVCTLLTTPHHQRRSAVTRLAASAFVSGWVCFKGISLQPSSPPSSFSMRKFLAWCFPTAISPAALATCRLMTRMLRHWLIG